MHKLRLLIEGNGCKLIRVKEKRKQNLPGLIADK